MSPTVSAALALIASYLLGSILFGILVVRALTGLDPRGIGSGNPGATNALRAGGVWVALLVLLLDAAKGALGVFLARALSSPDATLPAWAALAAIGGHMFPIFFRFQGGKGVATAAGAYAALAPAELGIALLAFGAMLVVCRIASVASLSATLVFALAACWGESTPAVCSTAWVAALAIVARHHRNLVRLWRRTEPRLGGGVKI